MVALRRIKAAIRSLIPDPLMARIRLERQSLGARTNVDVIVASRREGRRWLRTTPDTYRVRHQNPDGEPPSFAVCFDADGLARAGEVVVVTRPSDDDLDVASLVRDLADPTVTAAVIGGTPGPALIDGRRADQPVAPRAIALRRDLLSDVGPLPDPPDLLPALLDRLVAAGHRITLLPTTPTGAPRARRDPIDGPAAAVLSLVPLHDVGGGSRPAQMARTLLTHGFHVTFVNAYPSNEFVDVGMRFLHPRLEQAPAAHFDPVCLASRTGDTAARLCVVAAPAEPLRRAAEGLRASGFTTVYDMIDDWSGALGGDWYRPDLESRLVHTSTTVLAATPDLLVRVDGLGAVGHLVPNGVDIGVFGAPPGQIPGDFPGGEGPVLGYHGSLWAEWFDWEAVAAVADAYPEGRIILIGDDRGRRPLRRSNVHYLGLKPQQALTDYVARFDAGLLPRVVGPSTHAMSPLKVYEYLAAGVPVAAPPLRSLAGLDGVHTAGDLPDAVAASLSSPPPDPQAVWAEHSWEARVGTLLDIAGITAPPGAAEPATIVLRPPVHYTRSQRR